MATGDPPPVASAPAVVTGAAPPPSSGVIRPAAPTGAPVISFTPAPQPAHVPWAAATADHPICTRRAGPRGTSRQMLGVCGWATALSLVGLAAGLRGLVAVVAGVAPNWYEPTVATIGLGGMALTMVAFLSIRRRRLPWIMLGLATLPLAVNLTLTIAAL
jgi:hypothetical protein